MGLLTSLVLDSWIFLALVVMSSFVLGSLNFYLGNGLMGFLDQEFLGLHGLGFVGLIWCVLLGHGLNCLAILVMNFMASRSLAFSVQNVLAFLFMGSLASLVMNSLTFVVVGSLILGFLVILVCGLFGFLGCGLFILLDCVFLGTCKCTHYGHSSFLTMFLQWI